MANFAISAPWNGSMKQARKTKSPTAVTLGLVLAGEIMGMRLPWPTGAAASERLDATSPSTATTWSSEICFCTAVTAAFGLDLIVLHQDM